MIFLVVLLPMLTAPVIGERQGDFASGIPTYFIKNILDFDIVLASSVT